MPTAPLPAAPLPNDLLAELTAFRQDLHRHPEPGAETPRSAEAVARRLTEAGLEVATGVGGHGVVATLRRADLPAVGFRADMDALPIQERTGLPHASTRPGAFHGCGHDGHTTMLLGAALSLAADPGFRGHVRFLFQPDEETGGGAQAMIEDGLFERFPMASVYGLHNWPGMALGRVACRDGAAMAFEDNFAIRVSGRGGHASQPHRSVDAILVGAEIVCALQSIVARALDPAEHAVVSVTGFETDGARNVLASEVVISGDCRGFSEAAKTRIRARMAEIAQGVAAAHGARAEVAAATSFSPLVNGAAEAETCRLAAADAGLSVEPDFPPVGGAEDFARFLDHVPGAFAMIGAGEATPALHNPGYDFPDALLAPGIAWWTALARRLFA